MTTYIDELKTFDELREHSSIISIHAYPNFDAPGYELTGGTNFCGNLDEAKAEIERNYSKVWSVGFENNPDHEWHLVAYEVFKTTELVTRTETNTDRFFCHGVIFCYYRPLNPEIINALLR